MAVGRGNSITVLKEEEVEEIIRDGTPPELYKGKKILVITPDGTRTAPLPMMIRALHRVIGESSLQLDFMVALGTHRLLDDSEILNLYGIDGRERETRFKNSRFLNHRWDLPDTLVKVGTIDGDEIETLTEGLFRKAIDIDINRNIFDYDLIVILGPVFPHEVAGFSGGNKYLFPGIAGGKFLHFFHWVGAVITCWKIIGRRNNPVRRLVDRAAALVPVSKHCIAMVVTDDNRLVGLSVGTPEKAWSEAAGLSSKVHILRKQFPYELVIGSASPMYDELWTAGKVMYKLEPVIKEGGELIIYGEHVKSISHTWGSYIEKIGYHVRDYFLSQMDRFRDIPLGVLAHSTHVKGLGTYIGGVENPRAEVSLATSLSENLCRKINLGYVNPEDLNIDSYENREQEGILVVRDAGEILYRLESDESF